MKKNVRTRIGAAIQELQAALRENDHVGPTVEDIVRILEDDLHIPFSGRHRIRPAAEKIAALLAVEARDDRPADASAVMTNQAV